MEIPIPKPWELHPMLVHFPIAFLLGGVVLGVAASERDTESSRRRIVAGRDDSGLAGRSRARCQWTNDRLPAFPWRLPSRRASPLIPAD